MGSLVVRDATQLVTFEGPGPMRAGAMKSILVRSDAAVGIADGLIASVGSATGADAEFDARGCTVVPGFVDCHTHLPFYGWRADEDAARLSGVRYETLHRDEGGIFRSARLLSEAGDDEILDFARRLANEMVR
ncbi:MAG: hypothetical protein ACRDJ0_16665, partial [Actinomycetota bacterium]